MLRVFCRYAFLIGVQIVLTNTLRSSIIKVWKS